MTLSYVSPWCQQRWSPCFEFLGNNAVFFFYVLFLTVLPQEILSLITYSREELLDIRETSTYQHYCYVPQFLCCCGIVCVCISGNGFLDS